MYIFVHIFAGHSCKKAHAALIVFVVPRIPNTVLRFVFANGLSLSVNNRKIARYIRLKAMSGQPY